MSARRISSARGEVHAGAHRGDDSLVSQLDQGRYPLGGGLFEVILRIVEIEDVEPVKTGALERRLHRAKYPVSAEVPLAARVRGYIETRGVAFAGCLWTRHEQSADLGRDDVLVARALPEGLTETPLREPDAVMRSGVEVADACIPRSDDRLGDVLV